MGSVVAALLRLVRSLSRSVIGLRRELFPIEEWAGQYEEDAVDPDIAIFDAHHHLWDPRVHDKGWPVHPFVLKILYSFKPHILNDFMAKDVKLRNSFGNRMPACMPYMAEELKADIKGSGRGHKVVGTVYVECGWKTPGVEGCMATVREADMVAEVHRRHPGLCNGIVAHVDLRLGKAVEPALQYLSKNSLVKGIRHPFAWSADPTIVSHEHCDRNTAFDAKFREAFALLAKYGFSFDTWLYHEQVAGLADLASAFPETTIICDHQAFPLGIGSYRASEVMPRWKDSMQVLAKLPNVVVKVGGLGMRLMGFGFDERAFPPTSDELVLAWKPYVLFVVETFGVDRCIMESNFPMDKISCSYTVLFNALKKIVKGYSIEDRRKMFELNAKRVYRI